MKKLIVWAIVLVGGGYLGAKMYLHYRVSSDLDKMLTLLSPFAKVDYSGISSTMDGTLSVDDIEAKVHGYRDPIRVQSLSLITPSFLQLMKLGDLPSSMAANEIPESLAIGITGLNISADAAFIDQIRAAQREALKGDAEMDAAAECTGKYGYTSDSLKRLGYTELVMDLQMGYRKAGQNMVVDVRTDIHDMYDMIFEFTLDGAASPQSMAMGTYRPRLVDARLEYVDQSLEERTTRLCERAGLSPEEIVAAKLDAFMAFGANSGMEFDEQIVEPYKEFLQGKSRFILTAKPHEPVNISQIDLYKPSDVPALLNLTAAAQ